MRLSLPLGLHVHRPFGERDVGHMATEGGGSVPLVGVLDIHVNLRSISVEKAYIVHSLSPLEGGTNHRPVILVAVDHILYFLKVGSS